MSVQRGQVGKFKVLDLLVQCSVGAWSGWQGLQICNILQWPDLLYFQDSWNPVQIGVAGQHLASESALGCFQPEGLECWTLACCSQQVGNLQHGQAASLKCWICLTVQGWSLVKLAGVADLQHFALVGCFAIKTCSWISVQIQHGQVGRSGQICFAFKTCSWSRCSWAAFGQ